jgi:cyclic pyranopterin phosphate synthase
MPAKLPVPLRDRLGRPLESLRLSVTDRCNLRCLYCMPEEDYVWLPRQELLSFEELVRLVDIFTELGVTRLRLTGGEPLLRHNVDRLVAMLAQNPRITDLAMTTNGVLFADQAEALKRAGLGRVTISLDTLQRERFRLMTRRDEHDRVLSAFGAARGAGFKGTKLDAVIMRGENDDELADLIEFGRKHDVEVRFIEYMDVLGATKWRWYRLRHHRLHDFTFLPNLRSQPHYRGWGVVSLFICDERHRFAEAAARHRCGRKLVAGSPQE